MKCIPVGFRVSSIFLKFILKIGFPVFPVTASYLVTESLNCKTVYKSI